MTPITCDCQRFPKNYSTKFQMKMKFYIKKLIIKFAIPHHRNPQSTYALEAILLCPCSHSCHTLIQLSWHSFIVVQLYCLSVVQSQLWLFSHSFKYGGAVISVCLLCRLMDGVSARWAVCLVLSKRGRLMPKISHAAVLICSTVPLGLALVSVCSLIHSIHYLGSSGVCLLSMHGPKNIFLCFLSYSSPLPYPTLSLPHFFFFFLSCELLCYTTSITQIPVFVVENDTSITFVFFPLIYEVSIFDWLLRLEYWVGLVFCYIHLSI